MADPNPDNLKLLLHMVGANGGTTFTDSSPVGRTPSATANVQTTTAQSKWGISSGQTTSAAGTLTYAASADFAHPGPWTMEGWVYFQSLPSISRFWATGPSNFIVMTSTSGIVFTGFGSGILAITPGSITLNVWHHLACIVNSSNQGRMFWDGVPTAPLGTAFSGGASSPKFNVFGVPDRADLAGFPTDAYMADFRFCREVLYDGTFTPPSTQFANIVAKTCAAVGSSYASVVTKYLPGIPRNISASSTVTLKPRRNIFGGYTGGTAATALRFHNRYAASVAASVVGVVRGVARAFRLSAASFIKNPGKIKTKARAFAIPRATVVKLTKALPPIVRSMSAPSSTSASRRVALHAFTQTVGNTYRIVRNILRWVRITEAATYTRRRLVSLTKRLTRATAPRRKSVMAIRRAVARATQVNLHTLVSSVALGIQVAATVIRRLGHVRPIAAARATLAGLIETVQHPARATVGYLAASARSASHYGRLIYRYVEARFSK